MTRSEKIKAGQAEFREIRERCAKLTLLLKMFDVPSGVAVYKGKSAARRQTPKTPFYFSAMEPGRFEFVGFWSFEALEAHVHDRIKQRQAAG